MLILGLTGGIATGKSTVSTQLAKCGAAVWDADAASRKVVEPGEEGNTALRKAFGDEYFLEDGSLDRKKLGRDAFADAKKVVLLNNTLHPYILKDMCLRLAEFRSAGAVVAVVDAPLLFETGADKVCDEIWMTSCGVDEQVRRIMARDGLPEDEAMARINSQMTEMDRRHRSSRVIDTTAPLEDVARFVTVLFDELVEEENERMRKDAK